MLYSTYSTEEFEAKFTYAGNDLGASWTPGKTRFRLWAPTADAVWVNLYRSGTPGTPDLLEQLPMERDIQGTWIAEKEGDLHGTYYTYLVSVDGNAQEACDPYARTTGVNGRRAMVLNLRATDPEGWDKDTAPHAGKNATDAVIYELHVRDLSCHSSAGILHPGKFLGIAEEGTTTPGGIPTGLDHMKALGITHLHLLPIYDFGSVDESRPEIPQYNWGYDPVNYNVPEGSYATDPYHGAVRVLELKQMVKKLHEHGIGVVMDVVYNHVYDAGSFCFNRIVPGYFSRIDDRGSCSNGSGCGNDTASERSMVRKYIVDSVKYWASEYHLDGFRFDLAGLIDTDTIRAVMDAVHAEYPHVLFYGEGWNMGTKLTKPGCLLTNQDNAACTPGFAFFSDTMRDLLRGSVFNDHATGFVSGAYGLKDTLNSCFLGHPHWSKTPAQTVNYASCHDNMALFDRLVTSNPQADFEELVAMNKLCAAICLTSQGIPFFPAGEEFLRSKPLPGGGFDHNSYRSPDSVNTLKWDTLHSEAYREVLRYYQGLIAFRKAHSALRMVSAREVYTRITCIPLMDDRTAAYHITGGMENEPARALYVIFNASREEVSFSLPDGKWDICIDGNTAGTAHLQTVEREVAVAPVSAMVLTQGQNISPRRNP